MEEGREGRVGKKRPTLPFTAGRKTPENANVSPPTPKTAKSRLLEVTNSHFTVSDKNVYLLFRILKTVRNLVKYEKIHK